MKTAICKRNKDRSDSGKWCAANSIKFPRFRFIITMESMIDVEREKGRKLEKEERKREIQCKSWRFN